MDELVHSDHEAQREPLLQRPFWRGALTGLVVVLMLLALWVLFPSEYWRF